MLQALLQIKVLVIRSTDKGSNGQINPLWQQGLVHFWADMLRSKGHPIALFEHIHVQS